MSQNQSDSLDQAPNSQQTPLVLPSRLDHQRHVQALREAVHYLELLQGLRPPLHRDQLQHLDRALIRLTFCVLHLDPQGDLLPILGIHEATADRLLLRTLAR